MVIERFRVKKRREHLNMNVAYVGLTALETKRLLLAKEFSESKRKQQ